MPQLPWKAQTARLTRLLPSHFQVNLFRSTRTSKPQLVRGWLPNFYTHTLAPTVGDVLSGRLFRGGFFSLNRQWDVPKQVSIMIRNIILFSCIWMQVLQARLPPSSPTQKKEEKIKLSCCRFIWLFLSFSCSSWDASWVKKPRRNQALIGMCILWIEC